MKLQKLELRAIGPFTDFILEFPDNGPGLQLIHGPNEAGKSTTLRALHYLLFGFPMKTTDDHVHSYAQLRIGATFIGADGKTLAVVRRKAASKTLRDGNDDTVINEDILSRLIGNLDKDRFWSLYACDSEEVRKGSDLLKEGKGNFSEILFSGAGLSRLPEVKRWLEQQASEQFAPNAQKPKINAALRELITFRKEAKDTTVASSEYLKYEREHFENLTRLETLGCELKRVEVNARRIERLKRALPLLADRADAAAKLYGLGLVPRLSDDFAKRRFAAVVELEQNRVTVSEARARIAEINQELDVIVVSKQTLDEMSAISDLRERRGSLRRDKNRRAALVDEARLARHLTETMLIEIAPSTLFDEAETLRPKKSQVDLIQSLGRERGVIVNALEESDKALQACDDMLEPLTLPEGLNTQRMLDALKSLLDDWATEADPERSRETALADLAKRESEAEAVLGRLPYWSGSLSELLERPVPADTTVFAIEERSKDAISAHQMALKAERDNAKEIAKLAQEATKEVVGGDPPSEAELVKARDLRETYWQAVRSHWLEGHSALPAEQIASSYIISVNQSDLIADRLRREAGRVASRAERETKLALLQHKAEGLKQATSDAIQKVEQALSEWEKAWREAGIEPGSPTEMRTWYASYRTLEQKYESIKNGKLACDIQAIKIQERKHELSSILASLEDQTCYEAESLTVLKGRAKKMIAQGDLLQSFKSARRKREQAQAKVDEWRIEWSKAVRSIALGAESTPNQAQERLDRIKDLLTQRAKSMEKEADVVEIDREQAEFEGELLEIAARTGIDGPEEGLFDKLVADLGEAERALIHRNTTIVRLEAERKRLRDADEIVLKQTEVLNWLCKEAGCESPDDLSDIESRSTEARDLRNRVRDNEQKLLADGEGLSVDEIEREASTLDRESLPSELDALDQNKKDLQAEIDSLRDKNGELRQRLAAMDGPSTASDANQTARLYIAQIESDVEQYARVKLASAILRQAIDRYHERYQSPVLKRLGGIFCELTNGAFSRVIPDDEQTDKQVLIGVRSGQKGEHVKIDGMSQGTRDSLYLAVRLATIEAYFDEREPMPFFLDDILVHFDDARAAAALRVLARIAERSQILFFTHHQHLIDIAHKTLPKSKWRHHELPLRSNLALTV